jgi:predicted hydrocarbon binding protein
VDESALIYRKILNYLYLTLSKTVAAIPFSGKYWLEEVTRGVGERVLREYGEKLELSGRRPLDICQAYLNVLDREGFLRASAYQLEEEGENVLVTLSRSRCVYQDFCRGAEKESLFFYCPRLGALQAALQQTLHVDYSTAVELDAEADTCHGRIYPAKRLKTEIVTRDGDLLKIAGERAILLPKETYASILVAIREYAPHIIKTVLYDAGYYSALTVARQAKTYYNTPLEALEALFEEVKNCGLARVELVSLEPEAGRAVIRCYNSFQVATVKKYGELYRTPRVVCDLLRGMFSAYLTVILERPVLCEEMRCESLDGEYCEFYALPDESEPQVVRSEPLV